MLKSYSLLMAAQKYLFEMQNEYVSYISFSYLWYFYQSDHSF